MAITPYRVRITSPGYAPPWMRDGTSERYFYAIGAVIDARMEKLVQGVTAHFPIRRNPDNRAAILGTPPADALDTIGSGYNILRGLTESDVSYGTRLQRAFDSWRFAGTSRGLLMQILGYLLAFTPQVRFIATRYDPSTYPPSPESSTWDTYPAGRDPNAEPVRVYAPWGGNGSWDWDGTSPITGSWGWWSGYLVLYAVAPNAFVTPTDDWGTGSVYTPAADGYYSTTSGGAYVLAGSYAGSSEVWGHGSVYSPSADGYYSTVSAGAYIPAGSYTGTSDAWGVTETTDIGQSLVIIARQFKGAHTWIRVVAVSFDLALFDPAQPEGGGINPDGTWGQWSIVSGGAYVESRFTNAVYGDEVI